MILQAFCQSICESRKVCKFTIYRHLTITVNGPDFPMLCLETHGTETDYSNLSGFKEHFKKKNPTTFPGLI